jgi:hypothetical protein
MANSLVKLTLESNQYEKNIREAQKSWNQFVNGIGLSVGKITAVGAAIGAVTGALKVARDAFFKSEEHLDDWNRAIGMAESTYNGFLNALNTGDISGFLQNISTITEAARAAYDAMDELGTFNAFNQVNTQRARTGMTEAMAGYKMGETSKDQVKAAAAEYKKQLQERQRLETEAYRQQIRKLAAERGVSWGALEQALTGKYGDYKKLKSVMPTGERMVTTGGGMFTSNSYIEKYAINPQEKMGEALRALNDTELQNLQALGAQAQRTGEEIAQVDKQLSRIMNGKGGGGVAELQKKIKVGGGGGKKDVTYAPDSLAAQNELVNDLKKKWYEAAGGVRDQYLVQLVAAEKQLKKLNDEQAALRDKAEGKLKGGNVQTKGLGSFTDWKEIPIAGGLREDALNSLQNLSKMLKTINNQVAVQAEEVQKTKKAWNEAGTAVGAVGTVMNSIKNPAAQTAGAVAQAIANIALAYSQAIGEDGTIKSNIWYFIAATAAAMASMATTISAIHSATGYAEGGEVKGNSYSGDNIPIMANAGEIVLTRAMAGNLASSLQNNGLQNLRLTATLKGEDIRLSVNNNGRRTGRGEMVQSNTRNR